MESMFEEMDGTYRQEEWDYLIPDPELPPTPDYEITQYGYMHRSNSEEQREVFCTNLMTGGELFECLTEIDRTCCEHTEIIVSDTAKQEDV